MCRVGVSMWSGMPAKQSDLSGRSHKTIHTPHLGKFGEMCAKYEKATSTQMFRSLLFVMMRTWKSLRDQNVGLTSPSSLYQSYPDFENDGK